MWLFAFSLIVVVCAAKCTDADVSVEAAFQGRCGHGSPCEQLCYELHDGMYECDCTEGFELDKNGYSCQEINSTTTDENMSAVEEDVLYQRGASFSAKLDMSDLHISMKTFDDGDDEDGEGSMKPINLNALDSTLSLRKANHNWKTNSSKLATSKSSGSGSGRGQTNSANSSNNGDQKRPIVTGATAGRSKSDSSGTSSRSVHMEITDDISLHMQDADGSNPGEIKALALTAFEDDFDGGKVVASVSPPATSEESSTSSASTLGSTPVVTREPCTLDCGYEGICSNGESGQQQRCLCPFGKSGPRCEDDSRINTPRFNQHSWLAFPALRGAYKHVQLHIEFRPESFDGILLLTGEKDDLTGDFMALLIHQGFVEFWFDCGSGTGRVRSEETIVLNQWNTITIYRHRWDAWLVLNQGNRVQGRSKGLFSRITFREPVFLGGFGNITGLDKKLPVSNGFTGCIRKFVANEHDYNFQPLGDVSRGFDIQECVTDRCSRYPCQHGGKCLPSDDGAICLCPLGFGGDLCEMRLDLQVPSFNGSSYLRFAPLGDSCIIWFELKIIIKPLLEDGLLLYSGHHEYGDYISLCLNMGYVEFTFDLGSGPATVRSEFPLTMGQWHTIKISRTSRLAVLKIDQLPEVMTVSPNGFWHLSLPHSLYLGGVHNIHTLPMSLRDKGSFAGCVQKVDINDRTISIISEALGGSNVENCPHACVARPCGPLAKCVPNLDSYECQCNPQNKQCNQAEELPTEVIEQRQRLLKQHQVHLRSQDLVQEQQLEDDDYTTTTMVPSTKGVGGKGETGSGEDDYYYYEYDDESQESNGQANENSGRVKDNEKIIVRAERQQAEPANSGVIDDGYRDGERKGQLPGDNMSSNGDDDIDDKNYDGTGYLVQDDDVDGGNAGGGREYGNTDDGDDDEHKYRYGTGSLSSSKKANRFLKQKNIGLGKNFAEKSRAPEYGVAIKQQGGKVSDASTTNIDNGLDSETTDDDSQDESNGFSGSNDEYNKDYDQNGDRIPYRPDLVKKAGNEPRMRAHSKQTEREPDIDEILIEEMHRIMKNKDDGYESDDVSDGGPEVWDFALDDEEIRHAGTVMGGVGNSLGDDNENGIDVTRDAPDDERKENNQLRDKNTNLSKGATKMTSSSSGASARSSSTNNDRQHPKHADGEDGVSRSVKYKNKYYRRYQGACFTGTESFFHYSDAETMRRVISYEIDLNLRFKTHSTSGLILWTGRHSALEGDDFLSLGVENGFLHLRYNLGSGEVNIKYNSTKVSDGLWHRVRALRNSQEGTLKVDGGKPITRRSPGKLRQLNTDTGLYVGGLPAAAFYTRQRYSSGIVGCISELILAGELRLNFDSTILGTAHNVEPGAP
ncbi:basement membrane proteoglycan [Armigeres subalbatus]|uniref:basement membrane proteoglycan n=1 Tax=Armigeres subalbatus TaxID=124917 RepID=UPI002ED2E0C4